MNSNHRTGQRRAAILAHRQTNKALRTGLLLRPKHCAKCGAESEHIDGHHEDYSQPLAVQWLCRSCHKLHHIALGAARLIAVAAKYVGEDAA